MNLKLIQVTLFLTKEPYRLKKCYIIIVNLIESNGLKKEKKCVLTV